MNKNIEILSLERSLSEGADLWIIKNDPSIKIWQELDFYSKKLLSDNYIKDQTKKTVLLGTADHFLNRWVLLWKDLNEEELTNIVVKTCESLKTNRIRIFTESFLAEKLITRQTTSPLKISVLKN